MRGRRGAYGRRRGAVRTPDRETDPPNPTPPIEPGLTAWSRPDWGAPVPGLPAWRPPFIAKDPATQLRVAENGSDMGTDERTRHGTVAVVGRRTTAGGIVDRVGAQVLDGTVFDHITRTGLLGVGEGRDRRVAAAAWLLGVFHKAGLSPAVTANYSSIRCGAAPEMSTGEARARRLYNMMWRRIPPKDADLVAAVICYNEPPDPRQEERLRAALIALADWRGL